MTRLILALALLFVPAFSCAAEPDNNQGEWLSGMSAAKLLSYCQQTLRVKEGKPVASDGYATFCMGYIQGFTDGYVQADNSDVSFCIPHGVKSLEIISAFVAAAEKQPPSTLEKNATPVVMEIMAQTYPCERPKNPGDHVAPADRKN